MINATIKTIKRFTPSLISVFINPRLPLPNTPTPRRVLDGVKVSLLGTSRRTQVLLSEDTRKLQRTLSKHRAVCLQAPTTHGTTGVQQHIRHFCGHAACANAASNSSRARPLSRRIMDAASLKTRLLKTSLKAQAIRKAELEAARRQRQQAFLSPTLDKTMFSESDALEELHEAFLRLSINCKVKEPSKSDVDMFDFDQTFDEVLEAFSGLTISRSPLVKASQRNAEVGRLLILLARILFNAEDEEDLLHNVKMLKASTHVQENCLADLLTELLRHPYITSPSPFVNDPARMQVDDEDVDMHYTELQPRRRARLDSLVPPRSFVVSSESARMTSIICEQECPILLCEFVENAKNFVQSQLRGGELMHFKLFCERLDVAKQRTISTSLHISPSHNTQASTAATSHARTLGISSAITSQSQAPSTSAWVLPMTAPIAIAVPPPASMTSNSHSQLASITIPPAVLSSASAQPQSASVIVPTQLLSTNSIQLPITAPASAGTTGLISTSPQNTATDLPAQAASTTSPTVSAEGNSDAALAAELEGQAKSWKGKGKQREVLDTPADEEVEEEHAKKVVVVRAVEEEVAVEEASEEEVAAEVEEVAAEEEVDTQEPSEVAAGPADDNSTLSPTGLPLRGLEDVDAIRSSALNAFTSRSPVQTPSTGPMMALPHSIVQEQVASYHRSYASGSWSAAQQFQFPESSVRGTPKSGQPSSDSEVD